MPKFGTRSRAKLETCETGIQIVMNEAIQYMDFTVIYGFRGEKAQNEAFKSGNSRLEFPNSKHNKNPSSAIDIAPWVKGQIPWNKEEYFYLLAGYVLASAKVCSIKLRWGGDWGGDGIIVKYDKGESLNDLGHFELLE